jgi:ACR3 family arsenite transporter
LQRVLEHLQPLSLMALLARLVLLFGFQGEQILRAPLIIAMLSVVAIVNRSKGWCWSRACAPRR